MFWVFFFAEAGEECEDLNSFAEPHIVGEDSAELVLIEQAQPVITLFLVGAKCSVEVFGQGVVGQLLDFGKLLVAGKVGCDLGFPLDDDQVAGLVEEFKECGIVLVDAVAVLDEELQLFQELLEGRVDCFAGSVCQLEVLFGFVFDGFPLVEGVCKVYGCGPVIG